jgi:hypothetical protein
MITTLITKVILYQFDNEVSILNIFDYLGCLTLPLLILFFEKKISRKRILITAILFPLILTIALYSTGKII